MIAPEQAFERFKEIVATDANARDYAGYIEMFRAGLKIKAMAIGRAHEADAVAAQLLDDICRWWATARGYVIQENVQ